MGTLRVIYEDEPSFPPTDHHPDAVRYQVGEYWVDAVGTREDVDKILEELGRLIYQRRDDERAKLAREIIEKAKAPWWSAE